METRGRPTIMTPENIAKLEEAFMKGLNDQEACLYAGIGKSTLYNYCQENPDFMERKEQLKNHLKMRAKLNIEEEINKGDKPLSQWYLERRAKDEFSIKQEVEHSGDLPVKIIVSKVDTNTGENKGS